MSPNSAPRRIAAIPREKTRREQRGEGQKEDLE